MGIRGSKRTSTFTNPLLPSQHVQGGIPCVDHLHFETKLTLLRGARLRGEERTGHVNACIITSVGSEMNHRNIRLLDLVKQEWPEQCPNSLIGSLRSLNDKRKHDFLLRVTPESVFIRAAFIQAVIEPSRVIFLGTDNETFQVFLREFLLDLENLEEPECHSFRNWVLECILCAAVTLHSLRLQVLKPVVATIIENVSLDKPEDSVLQLYHLKVAMSSFTEQVRPLAEGIQEHVEDEKNSHHSEFEEIVDRWREDIEDVMVEAEQICKGVEDATRFLEASMSCMRNKLLWFELVAEGMMLAVGMGALISGIFGMNLTSGLENADGWFWSVAGGIFLLGSMAVMITFWFIRRSKHYYSRHTARFGNNKFFRHVDDNLYVLKQYEGVYNIDESEDQLSKASLACLLRDLQEPSTSPSLQGSSTVASLSKASLETNSSSRSYIS